MNDDPYVVATRANDVKRLVPEALDIVGAIIVIVTQGGKIVYVNRACLDATLRTPGEMVGRSLGRFLEPPKGDTVKGLLSRARTAKVLQHVETNWISKYDLRRRIDWSISAIPLDGGRTEYLILTGIDITERKRAEEIIREDAKHLHEVFKNSISAIAATAEKRDPYTAGHQNRVAKLATAIAKEMKLPPKRIEGIHFGSIIHDIGKIYVPAEILNRPGRLSSQEFSIITTHPTVGYDIVRCLPLPWPVRDIIHQHHERLDGSGYPQGLKGDEIAEEARIVAVADVVEAITSHRPYRPALGLEKGLRVLREGRGGIFDAAAVDACEKLFNEKGFAWDSANAEPPAAKPRKKSRRAGRGKVRIG